MSFEKVSILVPVYNAAPYLAAALDSMLAQDYPNLEIVAVDDGSSDNSDLILSQYSRRIISFSQRNAGASAARNRAFEESSGTYVLFMDADDLIGPSHISSLVTAVKRGKTGAISFSRWARFYDDPSNPITPSYVIEKNLSGVEWLLADWSYGLGMMQSGMFLLPRLTLERLGGWDERLSLIDDFEFFSRMFSSCPTMCFAAEATLLYRTSVSGSLSGRKSRHAVESQFLSLMLGTGHLLAAEDSQRTRRACANVLQQFDYGHYPQHPDLRAKARDRVQQLGGADVAPVGPPNFHRLRRVIGWRAARRVQRAMGRKS